MAGPACLVSSKVRADARDAAAVQREGDGHGALVAAQAQHTRRDAGSCHLTNECLAAPRHTNAALAWFWSHTWGTLQKCQPQHKATPHTVIDSPHDSRRLSAGSQVQPRCRTTGGHTLVWQAAKRALNHHALPSQPRQPLSPWMQIDDDPADRTCRCARANTMMSMPESWRRPIGGQAAEPPSALCTAACHAFALLLPRSCRSSHTLLLCARCTQHAHAVLAWRKATW
jgi:hypothetical protein